MPQRFNFDPYVMQSVVGGRSAIDMPKLSFKSSQEVESFLAAYGFDLNQSKVEDQLWYYYRRALVLLTERLGYSLTELPEVFHDRKSLGDLKSLLLWASSTEESQKELQKWSCAILRIMHVFVHSENDLFTTFSQEIQSQVLTPVQNAIFHDGTTGSTYLRSADPQKMTSEDIPLLGFEVKPFKTSSSTVIKLLAKPDALAMAVYDKLGFRFITRSMFDSFRVVRFLVEENLISYPHIMPDQSSNNLYPLDLFIKVSSGLGESAKRMSDLELSSIFYQVLEEEGEKNQVLRKANSFSGADYKFIKFICRKMIRIHQEGREPFHFFYPFEVQIMDRDAHEKILSGPSEHEAYKQRQQEGARLRLFPK